MSLVSSRSSQLPLCCAPTNVVLHKLGARRTRWAIFLSPLPRALAPRRLWPTLASGFGDLLKRAQVQAATMDENKQRVRGRRAGACAHAGRVRAGRACAA
jgi:hypothetical protein